MAQRELDIIAEARVTLNDVAGERWTTQRLMSLLNDAQNAMCDTIPLITNSATITTIPGQTEYRLPSGSVKLLRASSLAKPLQLLSYEDIEDIDVGWEDTVGSCKAIIVSALSQQTIRPYPASTTSEPIKVRYHAKAIELGWDDATSDCIEELSIDSLWDSGLRNFVIGQAFLDYGDEASNSRASTALGLFNDSFKTAQKLAKKSFAKRVVTTKYQAKVASNNTGDRYGSGNCRFRY